MPIYHLLVKNCQKRNVSGASYWYLEKNDELTPKELPDLETARAKILEIARQVKLARQLQRFKCPKEIIFTDSIPKGPSGKLLRRELLKRYLEK